MKYQIEKEDHLAIISIEGDILNEMEDSSLLDAIQEIIDDEIVYFIIDMKGVGVMSSSGLNLLLKILSKSRTASGDIVLSGITEKLSKLMIITRIQSMFNIASNVEEAKKILLEKVMPKVVEKSSTGQINK